MLDCGMTKKAVRKCNRSGTQPCAICEKVRILVEHHINGRDIPNAEAQWNRVWICATCHDEVHAGLKILEGWFSTTEGRKLIWREKGEKPKFAAGAETPTYGLRNS